MSSNNVRQPLEVVQDNLQGAQGDAASQEYGNGEQQSNAAPVALQGPTLEIMKNCRRWLLWREETNPNPEGKPLKVPYYANRTRRSGTLDTDSDLQWLVSFAEANQVLSQDGYSGLGFALGPDGGDGCWQGIDLDDIQRNHLSDLANNAPGYVEFSPSRLGIHAIGYGRRFNALGSNGTGVEAYSAGRFFTFTGEVIRDSSLTCLADFVEQRAARSHRAAHTLNSPHTLRGDVERRIVIELREALAWMRSDDYKLWTDMGLALAGLGDVGRGLWLEWSSQSKKYDAADASRKWETFKPNSINYETVFFTAQQHGWINPKSNEAQLPSSAQSNAFEINIQEAGEVTLEYLDNPWIPKRQAIGFYGRGESGKSSAAATFCARNSHTYSTLWITSEESEDHIKKRHEKLGGQLGTMGTICRPDFDVYDHLEPLLKQAKAKLSKPLGFVVLDSISALVTWRKGESPNDEASVKRLVGHIDRLAQSQGVSILMIGHMNKNKGHDHIADTVSGSLAWTSSTRLSYILQKVPEQDFVGFIRTAKSNLGSHFGAFYHTIPVHQMAPNIDGFRAALCGIEFEGQRIYGDQKLRMAMAEDDDAVVQRMDEKQGKIDAAVKIALHELKDGALKTRADLEAQFGQLKVSRRLWLMLDSELAAKNVRITNGQHNMKLYQLCTATPLNTLAQPHN